MGSLNRKELKAMKILFVLALMISCIVTAKVGREEAAA